jgi:hypothetical protein
MGPNGGYQVQNQKAQIPVLALSLFSLETLIKALNPL